ncbi:hypothetical protein JCM10213v2_001374 [Rhodosporidiobolus nylandii]
MFRPASIALSAAAALLLAPRDAQAAYSLTKDYSGDNFFAEGSWNWYGNYDNLTNGDIIFVNQSDSSDIAYINSAGNAIIKVDNTSTVPYNEKRRSVRIQSQDEYPIGSMWVFDFLHVPYGCSVWPAAWSQAAQWPQGGEIDSFEGVNLQTANQYALHTTSGCTADASSSANPFTGNLTYDNCDKNVNSNSGCSIIDRSTASYGEEFAAAGGGVWATEMGKDGIKIWFFSRADVPSDLLTSNSSAVPDPSTWGEPAASYGSSCDIPQYFAPQHLVLDITACGDWAGQVTNSTGCPLTTDLCYTSFVLDSTNFQNAYFEIPSIRVYYDADKAADSAASTTATTTASGSASSATTSAKSGSSASSGSNTTSGAAQLGGVMNGVVGAAMAVAVGAWTLA